MIKWISYLVLCIYIPLSVFCILHHVTNVSLYPQAGGDSHSSDVTVLWEIV